MSGTTSRAWTLHAGDVGSVLAGMPTGPANCTVTRPPYQDKPDYGVARQHGHEASPGAYAETLRDVLRVLAGDGTCTRQLPLGTGSRTRLPGCPGSRTPPREYGPGTRQVTTVTLYCHDRNRRRARPKGRKPGGMWPIPGRPYACQYGYPGARTSGGRQIRRKAGHVRKAGMRPMIFTGTGQFPARPVVISAGQAWHYRSELTPLAAAMRGPGLWPYLACPHLIAGVAVAAPAVGVLGAFAVLARLTDRVYLAFAALAADGWLAGACVPGLFTAPASKVPGTGMLIVGAPWRSAPMPARAAQPWRR